MRDHNRLRKLVTPKHALMAINEIKGVSMTQVEYKLTQTLPQPLFLAEAKVNGVEYSGTGPSKNAAKTELCDKALKALMVSRMAAQAKAQEENREPTAEEEVPMLTLVSYAIHKLFADWEAQGCCMKCGGSKTDLDPCICSNATVPSLSSILENAAGSSGTVPQLLVKNKDGEFVPAEGEEEKSSDESEDL